MFELIKAVSDTVLDVINAIYHDKHVSSFTLLLNNYQMEFFFHYLNLFSLGVQRICESFETNRSEK